MVNLELLSKMSDDLTELQLTRYLPSNDPQPLRTLFRFLKSFYRNFPPEKINGKLTIIHAASKEDFEYTMLDCSNCLGPRNGQLHEIVIFPAVIAIFDDGDYSLWNEYSFSHEGIINENNITYELDDSEKIWIRGEGHRLQISPVNSRSLFSEPTYWDLETALENYYHQMAKKSSCSKIKSVWADDKRLRWRNAPEHSLRDSLWNYLRITLRGAEVKREQNVNEEEPVDIKVTWTSSRARSLIEIKWLGISINNSDQITQNFSASRAKDGARQLRDYIDKSIDENPDLSFIGYLVTYDGRRQRVRNQNSDILPKHAWFYKNNEIDFQDELLVRQDLGLKFRFYMEPAIAG